MAINMKDPVLQERVMYIMVYPHDRTYVVKDPVNPIHYRIQPYI